MTHINGTSRRRSIPSSSTASPRSPIKIGLQLQPGQDLLLTAPDRGLPLVRRIAEHAYKAGAGW